MSHRLLGILAIITTGTFLIGIIALAIYNRSLFGGLMDDLGLMALNFSEMKGQALAAYFIYVLVGVSVFGFGISLLMSTPNHSIIVIGKLMLIASGALWASLGLTPYERVGSEVNFLAARAMLIEDCLNPFALIIIGSQMRRIVEDRLLMYYTILSGLLALFLPWVNSQTFIRDGNIALTIYFVWFGFFGVRLLTRKPMPNMAPKPVPIES